jgi:hypothetical protein
MVARANKVQISEEYFLEKAKKVAKIVAKFDHHPLSQA